MIFAIFSPAQLILKYACMLDVEKTIWIQKTWIKFNQDFWQNLFSQGFGQLIRCQKTRKNYLPMLLLALDDRKKMTKKYIVVFMHTKRDRLIDCVRVICC